MPKGGTGFGVRLLNDAFGVVAATVSADLDLDGFTDSACGGTDCDDTDAAINPGATEVCDSVDNNCDGKADEGVLEVFCPDLDVDGFDELLVSTPGQVVTVKPNEGGGIGG